MNKIEIVKNYFKQHLLLLILGLVAVILAVLYVSGFLRPKAVQPLVNITASPVSGSFNINSEQKINFIIKPADVGNKITVLYMSFVATGNIQLTNVSEIKNFNPPAVNPVTYSYTIPPVITDKRIHIEGVPNPVTALDAQLPEGVQVEVTFKGTGIGIGTISVDRSSQAETVVMGHIDGDYYDYGTVNSGNFTFTQAVPSFSLSPSTGNYTAGQNFAVQILMNTAGKNVDSADVIINYDKTRLTAVSVTPGTIFSTYTAVGGGTGYIDSTIGQIKIGGQIALAATPTPVTGSNLVFATINFQALSTGTAPASFLFTLGNRNDTNMNEILTNTDILAQVTNGQYTVAGVTPTVTLTPVPTVPVTGTPVPTLTPTTVPTRVPTAIPTATLVPTRAPTAIPTVTPLPTVPPTQMSLNLKIQLQGRSWQGATQLRNVKVKVVGTSIDTLVRTNSTGNVTGISLPNLTAGSYTFLIKPEGFLQRKTASTNLIAGVNNLDLTTIILLAGDVSGDNFVNSVDYVPLMAKYLSSAAAGSPDEIYDLDGSGQINNLDFSLMLNNWNKSGEQ